jgi:formamidopyrimidine-DNA glycosylase
MPELPDVEGFRRFLAKHAQGRKVTAVDVLDPALVRNRASRRFERALLGHRFGNPRRHGKWLIAPLGEAEVLMHFGMTGALAWASGAPGRHPHDRIIFVCEGGELRYNNMRRFGGIWLARDGEERERITGPLGPDAAALGWAQFGELLTRRRGAIKAALMDQHLIAGLGNLMCDEILWRACVHPRTQLAKLDNRCRKRIYEALRAVVSESSRYGRVPHGRRWLTRVRDDRRAVCPRCGSRLRWTTVAGRTACWCPRCQRAP